MSADMQQSPRREPREHEAVDVPQNKTINSRPHILMALLLTISLIILYYHGDLNKDWINRIGIILNLVIGLLFAPEVLERTGFLGKLVQRLEVLVKRLYKTSRRIRFRVARIFNTLKGSGEDRMTAVLSGILYSGITIDIIINKNLNALSFFLRLAYFFAVINLIAYIIRYFRGGKKFGMELIKRCVFIIIYPLLIPFFAFAIPVTFLVFYLYQIPIVTLRNALVILSRDEQIRSALIIWGIILFIAANLLQLIITF
jgi:hypothetical protein